MTDKERLEEIKHLYDYVEIANHDEDGNNVVTTLMELFAEGHIKWLIQRVWILEQRNRRISETALEQIDVTQARNKRLENRIKELETAIKGAQDIAKIQAAHIEELKNRIVGLKYRFEREEHVSSVLEKENQRFKQALELIHKDTYYESEHDLISPIHVIRKRAEKALEGRE